MVFTIHPDTIKRKLDVLRRHCDVEKRDYEQIVRTNLTALVLSRNEADLKAKRDRLKIAEPLRGFAPTVPAFVDMVGKYKDAGSQMVILSSYRNDPDTLDLVASDVIPKFKG